jgi:hypothetical protein
LVFQTEHGNDDNKISSFSIKRCRTTTRKLSSRRIRGNIVPSRESHSPKRVSIPSYLSIKRKKIAFYVINILIYQLPFSASTLQEKVLQSIGMIIK